VPLQVVVNAVGESNRIASDVFHGHRNGREAAFLQSGRLQPVTQHALATRVPLNAVVFGDDKRFRPRKVDAPDSAVPVDDAVLQLWHRNRASRNSSRASLSIADSARPSAQSISSRTLTIPRRPFCWVIVACNSAAVQAPTCRAASSVAKARDRRSVRATSITVHAGAVANRPSTRRSGAPIRWCTMRLLDGRIRTPGSSMWTRGVFSVSKPYNAAAVPMQATIGCPATNGFRPTLRLRNPGE
jgi:hypothetical protein